MRNIIIAFVIIFIGIKVKHYFDPRMPRAGIVAPADPYQTDAVSMRPLRIKDYIVKPVATYDITARVLLTDRYRFSDGADLVPLDLTLGWKKMSDSSIFSNISLSHGFRNYWWFLSPSAAEKIDISTGEIVVSSANTHIIPIDDSIKRKLFRIKQYDVVHLQGYLVNALKNDGSGWHWDTSTMRTDSSDGACELMLVEKVL